MDTSFLTQLINIVGQKNVLQTIMCDFLSSKNNLFDDYANIYRKNTLTNLKIARPPFLKGKSGSY